MTVKKLIAILLFLLTFFGTANAQGVVIEGTAKVKLFAATGGEYDPAVRTYGVEGDWTVDSIPANATVIIGKNGYTPHPAFNVYQVFEGEVVNGKVEVSMLIANYSANQRDGADKTALSAFRLVVRDAVTGRFVSEFARIAEGVNGSRIWLQPGTTMSYGDGDYKTSFTADQCDPVWGIKVSNYYNLGLLGGATEACTFSFELPTDGLYTVGYDYQSSHPSVPDKDGNYDEQNAKDGMALIVTVFKADTMTGVIPNDNRLIYWSSKAKLLTEIQRGIIRGRINILEYNRKISVDVTDYRVTRELSQPEILKVLGSGNEVYFYYQEYIRAQICALRDARTTNVTLSRGMTATNTVMMRAAILAGLPGGVIYARTSLQDAGDAILTAIISLRYEPWNNRPDLNQAFFGGFYSGMR